MDSLRIGALAPLTPPGWVEAGRHLLAGLELGVRDANAAGGVLGRPLELLVRDTAADPQKAEAAVAELHAVGVAGVVGEYHSVVARAAATRAAELGLPFLCSSAVLDDLTEQPSDWIARLAPPQSRGWALYADFLLGEGRRTVAVAVVPSVYWVAGAGILQEHLAPPGGSTTYLDGTADPEAICDQLVDSGASALLLLVGHPEPAVPIVRAVRADARLGAIRLGAPAGQPELASWSALLGGDGAAVPFLRYLPDRLPSRGVEVRTTLNDHLGEPPSFVAFEGYDSALVIADALRRAGGQRSRLDQVWSQVDVEGTRGRIRLERRFDEKLWQWTGAPIQVVDRDPDGSGAFRILRSST